MRRPSALLGRSAIRPLVLSQLVSLTGTHVTALALPTLAVLLLDAGPLAASLLFALQYGARGLTAPLVGVLVDGLRSPRRLLVANDLTHALVVASVPAMYLLDVLSLPVLVLVAAASGVLAGVTDISVNAVLPRLVPAAHLVGANASLTGARAAGQILGPALGGLLIQLLGAASAVAVDAVSYLFSAAILGRLRGAERPERAPASAARIRGLRRSVRDFRTSIGEGLATFREVPLLPRLALAAAALNVGGAGLGALYTVYAYRELGLHPVQVGVLWGVNSAAAMTAVGTARRVIRRVGLHRSIGVFAPVAAGSLLLIPAASLAAPMPLFVVYELLFGYCATVWTIASASLQQRLVPAERMGRVVAFSRTVSVLAVPIGAVVGGVAAGIWPLPLALAGFAVVALAGTTVVAVGISRRRDPVPDTGRSAPAAGSGRGGPEPAAAEPAAERVTQA
ncbi:MFS transporter [Micromonospora sp. NPDC048830]|uniref:MFS transporter n=1 Tax=Micromonospora sp. NPDC048830 TaxID=3364257 RepID=UPI0037174491